MIVSHTGMGDAYNGECPSGAARDGFGACYCLDVNKHLNADMTACECNAGANCGVTGQVAAHWPWFLGGAVVLGLGGWLMLRRKR